MTLEPYRPAEPEDPHAWHRMTSSIAHGDIWIRPCPGTVYPAVDLALARWEPLFHTDPALCHIAGPDWVAFCERIKDGDLDYLETEIPHAGTAPETDREPDHDSPPPLAAVVDPPELTGPGAGQSEADHHRSSAEDAGR